MAITKKTLVEFDEQAKCVTAKVSLEVVESVEGGEKTLTSDELLAETKRLFSEAQTFALNKSFLRNR